MKKSLTLILLATLFISCSSDDDDYSNSDIVGTWTFLSSAAKEVKTNNDKATQAIKKDMTVYGNGETTLTFSADGTYFTSSYGEVWGGTYSLKGNTLTLTSDGETESSNIQLSNNTFSADIDETDYYEDEVKYLVPNETNVVVSKAITTYTYQRK